MSHLKTPEDGVLSTTSGSSEDDNNENSNSDNISPTSDDNITTPTSNSNYTNTTNTSNSTTSQIKDNDTSLESTPEYRTKGKSISFDDKEINDNESEINRKSIITS